MRDHCYNQLKIKYWGPLHQHRQATNKPTKIIPSEVHLQTQTTQNHGSNLKTMQNITTIERQTNPKIELRKL